MLFGVVEKEKQTINAAQYTNVHVTSRPISTGNSSLGCSTDRETESRDKKKTVPLSALINLAGGKRLDFALVTRGDEATS